MPATYEPIASTTLGSNAADVSFTSISGTFTDLILVADFSTTGDDTITLQVNSDTASNYSQTTLYGNGSSATSSRSSNSASIYLGDGVFNQRNLIITQVMSYANTNVFKTVLAASATPSTSVSRAVGLWRSTNAITSVTIGTFGVNNLTSGSRFSLFGVKAA